MSRKRTQNLKLPRRLGRSLVAAVSLLVLFSSWLPHDHEVEASTSSFVVATSVASSAAFSVTADDSHDTHSSSQSAEELPCTLCRSVGEREEIAAFDAALTIPEHGLLASRPLFRAPALKPAPHARLYRGRAPPLSLSS